MKLGEHPSRLSRRTQLYSIPAIIKLRVFDPPDSRGRLSPHLTVQFFQLTLGLVAQRGQFLGLLAQIVDYVRRRLRQELLVAELVLSAGDALLDSLQFFFQALAFGGNVNLSLIDHVYVVPRRAAGPSQLGQRAFRK